MILWEGDPTDPTRKPPEMYTLVENFCLGLRRLELFARARSLRRGWVSVLADGEETHVPAVQARAADAQLSPEQLLDGANNVLGQELGVDRAERWDQDKWEAAMRGWLQNGRAVVPMTQGKTSFLFTFFYIITNNNYVKNHTTQRLTRSAPNHPNASTRQTYSNQAESGPLPAAAVAVAADP